MSQDQLRRRLSTPLPVFLTEDSATPGPCQKLSLYFFNDKTKSRHRGGWLEAAGHLESWPFAPALSPVASSCPFRPRQMCACPRAVGQTVGELSLFLLSQACSPGMNHFLGAAGWHLGRYHHNRWEGQATWNGFM